MHPLSGAHQARRAAMQYLDPELEAAIQRRLVGARVPQPLHADYHKWLSLYLRFCQQSGYAPTVPTALGPFLTQLAHEGHSIDQRHQAGLALRLPEETTRLESPQKLANLTNGHSGLTGFSLSACFLTKRGARPYPLDWNGSEKNFLLGLHKSVTPLLLECKSNVNHFHLSRSRSVPCCG